MFSKIVSFIVAIVYHISVIFHSLLTNSVLFLISIERVKAGRNV